MIIPSTEFVSKLQFIAAGTASHHVTDLYNRALLSIHGRQVVLRSFDLVCHSCVLLYTYPEDEETPQEGSFMLNLPRLIGAVSAADAPLSIQVDAPETELRISGGGLRLRHRCEIDPGFTGLPDAITNMAEIEDGKELLQLVRRASFLIDPSHYNPSFRGMYLQANGSIEMAGTDAVALSRVVVPHNGIGVEGEAILPLQAIRRLEALLSTGEAVSVGVNEERFSARAGDYYIISTLISDKFPNYAPLLIDPSEADAVSVRRADLARAVRVAAGYTDEYQGVYLSFGEDGTLAVEGAEAEKGTADMSLEYGSSDPLSLRIKASAPRLKAALSAMDGENLTIFLPQTETVTKIALTPGTWEGGDLPMAVMISLMNADL